MTMNAERGSDIKASDAVWVLLLLSVLSGCTTTDTHTAPDHLPLHAPYRILVMPPHARVGEGTARFEFVPNAEWEISGRANLTDALISQQMARGADVTVFDPALLGEAGQEKLAELMQLHRAVGRSVIYHQTMGNRLPTKRHAIDWTLGAPAVEIGTLTGQDHALFVFVQDTFATTGLRTVQVAALSTCIVGPCLLLIGPNQWAFASLVDLRTGDLVWFNHVQSLFGDVRTSEGAENLVGKLLGGVDAGENFDHAP